MIKSKRFEIRCDPVWYQRIQRKASERGMTVTVYIRTAIELGEAALDGEVVEEKMVDLGLYGDTSALIPGKEEKWTEQHLQT